jgi:hypothetical protein
MSYRGRLGGSGEASGLRGVMQVAGFADREGGVLATGASRQAKRRLLDGVSGVELGMNGHIIWCFLFWYLLVVISACVAVVKQRNLKIISGQAYSCIPYTKLAGRPNSRRCTRL